MTDIRTKKLLYITWVRSRLEYISVVWSSYIKRNIATFEQIQREIHSLQEYSEHERLSKLNLLPLQYRREINVLIFLLNVLRICTI